jgi:uncharacterized metal-binding protein
LREHERETNNELDEACSKETSAVNAKEECIVKIASRTGPIAVLGGCTDNYRCQRAHHEQARVCPAKIAQDFHRATS